jgi:uroporphyrinogen decarboxylase
MDDDVAPQDLFLRACRRLPVDRVPVWFMRQAGRSLPEYRKLRLPGSILETVRRPDLAAEITLQPVQRLGVDAAVLYSDIVVPVAAVGFGVEVRPGVGPVVEQPFTEGSDLQRLRALEPEADVPYVLETIRILRRELTIPLIGFAGAPFTLASYLVEGGPSRDHVRTKALMRREPELWSQLLDRLADLSVTFLRAQITAGAQAIQLFDSWVGELSPRDYARFVMPATAKVFRDLADTSVPRIHFGVGTGELLDLMASVGADVVGVDWRVPLDRARSRVGSDIALQGNLDPAVPLAGPGAVEPEVRRILKEGGGQGHIFNLGHGVHPTTDPDVLLRIVDLCHAVRVP